MFKQLYKLISILGILCLLSIYCFFKYQQFISTPINLVEPRHYVIDAGSNLKVISEDLKDKDLFSFPPLFLQIYGRVNKQASQIKAGEYTLQPGETLPDIMNKFVAGKVVMYSFSIIEGMTVKQIVESVANTDKLKKTLDKDNALKQLADKIALPVNELEGWFLPETYHFPAGTTDLDFLLRAHEQMQMTLENEWQNKAKDLPYKNAYEALIMASIIEKETAAVEERPIIAGVFVRRLQIKMRLQTDPTVIYGMGDKYKGNIRKKDLQTDTPYNTYTRSGLPPTPICLPSREAIHAALHPAKGNSLYFVATGENGRHVFSSNLRDHNNAVRKYQLKK